jgi:hypothetical protein
MSFLDIAGAYKLTGEQSVEDSTEVYTKIMFDELSVELCVVSNLDWTLSCKKLSQRRNFFTLTEVVSSKRIKIDYEDLIGAASWISRNREVNGSRSVVSVSRPSAGWLERMSIAREVLVGS